MSGILYVVATPIGNLEDITYRAVRVLGEVDLIACEDTRQTRKLLDHFGISRPTISYHEHNEAARSIELRNRLSEGASVALVSDAGTPLISDPGYRLVRAALDGACRVVPIPGPSAVMAALSASGLPTDQFRFAGFFPVKSAQRRKLLESFKSDPGTLIFYEAPHRIIETLADIHATLGDRDVVIARELTKIHEEFLRGTPGALALELRQRPRVKGELTVLIGRAHAGAPPGQPDVRELLASYLAQGIPRMEAIKRVARETGLSKRDVYRRTY